MNMIEPARMDGRSHWAPPSLRWGAAPARLAALLLSHAAACSAPPAEGNAGAPGATALMTRHGCAGCHTIPGVDGAESNVGPPLTALGRRVYVGGRLNTPRHLAEFIHDPSAARPSSMPRVGISPEEAAQVAAYLSQLR